MRKNLGSKRREIRDEARREIVASMTFLNGEASAGETAENL